MADNLKIQSGTKIGEKSRLDILKNDIEKKLKDKKIDGFLDSDEIKLLIELLSYKDEETQRIVNSCVEKYNHQIRNCKQPNIRIYNLLLYFMKYGELPFIQNNSQKESEVNNG